MLLHYILVSKTALLLNLHPNTINYWYMLFRDHQTHLEDERAGSIEVNDSYFYAKW